MVYASIKAHEISIMVSDKKNAKSNSKEPKTEKPQLILARKRNLHTYIGISYGEFWGLIVDFFWIFLDNLGLLLPYYTKLIVYTK